MWELVPRLLGDSRYLVLATADRQGRPWATPVFFAARDEDRLVWVSAPGSRHSRNIAERPDVAITVFDSHAPIGGAEALYLEATAGLADDPAAALTILNARLPASKELSGDDLGPSGPLLVYQADVRRHFILIRGGDPRFDNVTDARLRVTRAQERPPMDEPIHSIITSLDGHMNDSSGSAGPKEQA
ncbi:pyridoxamine 5'-phosphate oxidase family protein [Nonomuraea angiospora]|uniref:pyridoxamine 5'-phosphate oxidase family protein n=1 Tax=Nonomuraea angiospora TaxID=46172 RepID=UPI0029A34572|nr:pyridoxamine 5'-phosphate oxidase family protein [Nonomuraea angiospora]MDX3108825.1 pyridoxamine 5'-phosphate oxidase family protein [Nonomuraea angiospora]